MDYQESMMKKWITENALHTGIFCFMAIFLSFAIYNITHILLTHFYVEARLAESIGRLLGSIAIVIFYIRIFDRNSFGLKSRNYFRGILTGILMLFILIPNVAIIITSYMNIGAPVKMPSLYLFIIVIIEQIFVGIFEEFLFRGLILNTLLEKTKHLQYKGMIWSLLLSSLLFGSVHLLNLFDNPQQIYSTISQVFAATFIGVFLGALYLRSENIWVVVFYHALIDIASDLPQIFFNMHVTTRGASDIPFYTLLANILANSIILFAGLFIIRKSKSKYAEQDKTSK